MIQLDIHLILHVYNIQISDIFHNCPEQEEEQQQSNPKDLGSKCPRSKNCWEFFIWYSSTLYTYDEKAETLDCGDPTSWSDLTEDACILGAECKLEDVTK